MDLYVSEPIEIPGAERDDFSRADLIFEKVDHSGESFTARVFIDNPDADEHTPQELEQGYAGSFTIFGHGGCAGDEGHCDIPEDQSDPEDQRLLHPLTPHTKVVRITEALKRAPGPEVRITVVPVLPGESAPQREDVLFFDGIQLTIYD
jgi:tyrosinase